MIRKIWHTDIQTNHPKGVKMTAIRMSKQNFEKKRSGTFHKTAGVVLGCILGLLATPAAGHATPSIGESAMQTGPAAPASLSANRIFSNADEISWADASTNESFFTVEYRTASGRIWTQFSKVYSTSVGTTGKRYTVNYRGLPTGKYLCYRVAAVNEAGKTYSPERCAGFRPSVPKNLRLSINWVEAGVTFERSEWELRYRLYYQVNGAGQWFVKVANAPTYASTDASIFVDTGKTDTNYCFYVIASNDFGSSSPSNTVCGNTGPYVEP
ncbi:fibronectin type III domain-containing protein [Pseudarthrobacter sp. RMG13]|uniref:Fibronectin type III domain-containing protein n=1 Tax=Pseudarthrobacter humi TaxID=2952523 RepID=A0ABT1LKX3_9MICC|nr:fibronectin type III domain-containing protein [Pseudarthrobacter humi]MCP8999097.1 fibronectin type III domain-containing protein [Pseudarthrobacter humi]